MDKNEHNKDLDIDLQDVDSLDDESRRALLGKLGRIGAAVVPVSVVMLDAKKASAVGPSVGGNIGF